MQRIDIGSSWYASVVTHVLKSKLIYLYYTCELMRKWGALPKDFVTSMIRYFDFDICFHNTASILN